MNIHIPTGADNIISVLEQHGFEAYVVGGCVRDSLLGLQPNDWDICTNATPEQTKTCFSDTVKIIETGMKHGTLTVVIDSLPYEVTTYRIDGAYSDNRHPDKVKFVTSLQEDLSRRDFTINAMAYNRKDGLKDYFNGRADLERKLIRCVGDPDEKFTEDALRIMRALRFASTYGFDISESTKMSLQYYKGFLSKISVERINVELCKLLCGMGVEKILNEYATVLCLFIPEIKPMIGFAQQNPYHYLDVWKHTTKSVVNAPRDIVVRLTMLFHDIGKPMCYELDEQGMGHFYGHAQRSSTMAVSIMKRLKFDKGTILQVKELILYHDADLQPRNKHVKRWLNKIGEERLRQLLLVKYANAFAQREAVRAEKFILLPKISKCIDDVIEQQQCFCLKDLAVNGRDLLSVGIPKGVQIGSTLNWLLDKVIEEQVENNKEALLRIL